MNQKFIPLNEPYLTGDEWKRVKECFDTKWVSTAGPQIDEFGRKFADYLGAKYAVPVASGTAALHLAIRVLGIGPGDKVLVPSLTFIASVNPVSYVGAQPVFVDSEKETFNIDPPLAIRKMEEMIRRGEKPKAVLPVHLFGHAADMDPLLEFCRKNEIFVIEDATESLGTRYKGSHTGTLGDIGCFSFNGNKLITTGGGGMLVTADESWARKAKYLSEQARDRDEEWVHQEIGYNYRLGNIQAAFGLAQLAHLEEFIAKKKQIAAWYDEGLGNVEGISLNPRAAWCDSSCWLYSILIDEEKFGKNSREILRKLNAEKIGSRPFFKPVHLQPMYGKYETTEMNHCGTIWQQGINLPSSVGLERGDAERVIDVIRSLRPVGTAL